MSRKTMMEAMIVNAEDEDGQHYLNCDDAIPRMNYYSGSAIQDELNNMIIESINVNNRWPKGIILDAKTHKELLTSMKDWCHITCKDDGRLTYHGLPVDVRYPSKDRIVELEVV